MNFYQLFSVTEWRTKVAHGETVGFNSKMDKAPDGAEETVRGFIFFRPIWGLVRLVFLPTVSPWATFFRASGALATMILFFAVGARAETTNTLSDAEIHGRNLARQLADVKPTENFTNAGTLKIKDAKGKNSEILIKFLVVIKATNWLSIYEGVETNSETGDKLRIIHQESLANKYAIVHVCGSGTTLLQLDDWGVSPLSDETEMRMPFCQSDFWLVDLGLEFFHWPEQKILKKEVKRSRGCSVLESTNLDPSMNGYSRVVSWIDNDGGGIVQAFAYDAQGKLLKEFYPTSLKKVNGQYQVQEMEMINDQTKSRTRLTFDLKN
jgi:YD repeat-containing protein